MAEIDADENLFGGFGKDKVLIDVKSLYRMDELKASGMRFWRL